MSEGRHLPALLRAVPRSPPTLAAVFLSLRRLRHWLEALLRAPPPELSQLIIGSTGSGKSEGELVDLVRLAGRRDCAVVLLDGHGPLAARAAGHWGARGHENRIVYELLSSIDRVLCWSMLPKSGAPTLARRRIEDAETREEVAQCFLAQRDLVSLNDRPWTKEWLDAAIDLCLSQPKPQPLGSLLHAFRTGSAEYERLLDNADRTELVAKFRDLERLRRKSEVQYQTQTGASRRLLELVCDSEVTRLRSRPGPFDWLESLRQRKLIVFDGGGIRSRDLKRTLFLLVSMEVIHAVRRDFAQTQQPLPVVLVLEEAGALGLVTPFVRLALQELRKAGLAVHLITQSIVDFGDRDVFESLLANTPCQIWYQVLSTADQELGGKLLANATFNPMAVHYTRIRALADSAECVETTSRSETFDPKTRTIVQRERRWGTTFKSRYRQLADEYYKTPQLWEQEYRTQLATLRIGERLVRGRDGVRRERVRPVRAPWLRPISNASTQALIERIRRQSIYQPCVPSEPPSNGESLPDAAERLRRQA